MYSFTVLPIILGVLALFLNIGTKLTFLIVSDNSSAGDGTCFLREYMIPRDSTSFCLYDTRSFSNDLYENLQMIRRWMTKGVRHGKLVKRLGFNFVQSVRYLKFAFSISQMFNF